MRVMCVGASITAGADINGGYRLPLEKMLEGAGVPVQFVGRIDINSRGMTSPFHDGYSGLRIEQVEQGVDGTCGPITEGIREHKPDAVLILCGTNDVRQNYAPSHAPERMDRLIGTIRAAAPSAKIYVSSLPPCLHWDDAVRRYNSGVAEVVAARAANGEPVYFVDNYAALSPGVDILPDVTHPNLSGYIKIARGFFKVLAPDTPQIAFAPTYEGARQVSWNGCVGYRLTMKNAETVTALGIYCAGEPLTQIHAVGVFDASGKVLAEVQIAPTASPSGLFAYQDLENPLPLEAGQSYSFVSNSIGLPVLCETNAIVDPLFFERPRFYFDHNVAVELPESDGTILKFPTVGIHDLNGGLGYFGPNFRLALR